MLLNLRYTLIYYVYVYILPRGNVSVRLYVHLYVDMRYFDRKFHHYSLYSGGTSRRNVSFFPSFSFLFFFFFFIHYFLEIDFPFFDKIERVVLIPIVSSLIQSRIQPFSNHPSIHPSFLSYVKWSKESANWNWKDLIQGFALITIAPFPLLTKLTHLGTAIFLLLLLIEFEFIDRHVCTYTRLFVSSFF